VRVLNVCVCMRVCVYLCCSPRVVGSACTPNTCRSAVCRFRVHFLIQAFLLSVSPSLSPLLLPTGQVSRSSLKQPKSCNIFKALFCCIQAQDGPKLPPPPPPPPPPSSQHALLESQENGTVVKVTHYFSRFEALDLQLT